MFPFDPPENITKPKLSGTQDSAFEAVSVGPETVLLILNSCYGNFTNTYTDRFSNKSSNNGAVFNHEQLLGEGSHILMFLFYFTNLCHECRQTI